MIAEAQLKEELSHYIGTTQWYKHPLGLLYTDGVQHLASAAGAYWLLDAIGSYNRREHFQVWTLTKNAEGGAVLTMREDTGEPSKVRQLIPFTDFPLDSITLYLIDGVLLLTSEY